MAEYVEKQLRNIAQIAQLHLIVMRGRSTVSKYNSAEKAGKFQNKLNAFSKERQITDAN